MVIGRTALGETAPRTRNCVTACSGSDSTVAVPDYTTATPPSIPQSCRPGAGPLSSATKTAIVSVLGWVLGWRPSLAMRLSRFVTRIWPGMREA